ncbi:hypothetical protein M3E13_15645 [Oceanobacillus kimchii]|uniref:hypothetical protein n=1 Tax=Oceanobacillus kimchii TaxID=746691 RepID=UPI0021A3B9DC|nr:hypothetical protein [Oceanobacillus kimchii]MCT1575699.1 hypothetical protein [Oceanobacillus kimchii]MCT2137329.1 hypothetical protein [Oceanobacillus kimchii]
MNDFIESVLEPIGIPIEYQNYTGSEIEYIRFFYLPQIDFQSDDEEIYNTVYVQVDLFTPWNPHLYVTQIKQRMKQAGFKKNFEHELFEEDTELFHYVLRFYIIKEED